MKNIHILPTDNYSLLVHSTSKYGGYFKSDYYSPMKEMGDSYQHIYITSDEEIKEGDWVINLKSNQVYQIFILNEVVDYEKKIILTTDQDLIKDDVQAIDNDFLQWFVKNPSCESVEIERDSREVGGHNGGVAIEYGLYEIIIPKEEPKMIECYFTPRKDTSSATICSNCGQEKLMHTIGEGIKVSTYIVNAKEEPKQDLEKEMFELEEQLDIPSHLRWHNSKPKQEPHICKYCGAETTQSDDECYAKPKQETLEEAAERWNEKQTKLEFGKPHNAPNRIKAFIQGAKWQAERMYSEKDLKRAWLDGRNGETVTTGAYPFYKTSFKNEIFEKWFEQFKKK